MYLVAGRWGYSKHCSGDGQWLIAKLNKFAGTENTPTTKKVLRTVKNLIKQNNSKSDIYSFIFNCGLPTQEKNRLVSLLF